jgi:tRNA (cmo5U34)-methyltransferase
MTNPTPNINDIIRRVATDTDRDRLLRLPCADDIYTTLLQLVPFERGADVSVAILGAGDGFEAALILDQHPTAHITLIDRDEDRLDASRARFAECVDQLTWLHSDFAREDPPEKYHLIVSAMSLHHLNDIEKRALFRTLYSRMLPTGLFINIDHVKAPTERLQDDYRRLWADQCNAAGVDEAIIRTALEGMADDHPSETEELLEWLRNAGFRNVDTYYKNLMFAVLGGYRPDF